MQRRDWTAQEDSTNVGLNLADRSGFVSSR